MTHRPAITREARLRPLLPHGFRLLTGDDASAPIYIAHGGDGCVSLMSNVAPEVCRTIFLACRQARLQTARDLQHRLARLAALVTGEHPAALKYALCLLGSMCPNVRLPLVQPDAPAKSEIASAIAEFSEQDDLAHLSQGRQLRSPSKRPGG